MDIRQRFADYLVELPFELLDEERDPGGVLDRYYEPDFQYLNDGVPLDRQRLVDHVKPARRNTVSCEIDVHEVLVDGHRAAARFTLHAVLRKGRRLSTQVHLFADYGQDGRIRQVHGITRDVTAPS